MLIKKTLTVQILLISKSFLHLSLNTIFFTCILSNICLGSNKIIVDQETKNGINEINLCKNINTDCMKFEFPTYQRQKNVTPFKPNAPYFSDPKLIYYPYYKNNKGNKANIEK